MPITKTERKLERLVNENTNLEEFKNPDDPRHHNNIVFNIAYELYHAIRRGSNSVTDKTIKEAEHIVDIHRIMLQVGLIDGHGTLTTLGLDSYKGLESEGYYKIDDDPW